MNIKYGRDYANILQELIEAVSCINNSYSFFEMEEEEWSALEDGERYEVMEALADDVFFGLGQSPVIKIGDGEISYHADLNVIKVLNNETEAREIKLVLDVKEP